MSTRVIRMDSVKSHSPERKAYIFADASTQHPIGSLDDKTYLQVIADEGGFVKFKYNGSYAYISVRQVAKGHSPNPKYVKESPTPAEQRQTLEESIPTPFSVVEEHRATPLMASASTPAAASTKAASNDSAPVGTYVDLSKLDKLSNDQLEEYRKEQWKWVRSLGVPPKYNMDIDVQYTDELSPGIGRVYARTMLSHPSILSLCPGEVDFLPGFNAEEKDTFFEAVKSMAAGNSSLASRIQSDYNKDLINGKLYTFRSAYGKFANVLNILCRATAIMLGIGDKAMPHTGTPLKSFDFSYWCLRNNYKPGASQDSSIFKTFWSSAGMAASGAVTDANYMHFFLTNSETNISETIETGVESSKLEQIVNESTINDAAKNLNYLFGGAVGGDILDAASRDFDKLLGDQSGFIKKFGNLVKDYVRGGRMIFPQMLGDITYGKSIACSLTFVSPYGDPLAIFLNCYVPIMHILALSLPKQLSDNMFTYPFIVRCYQQGWFNSDLAVITDVKVERGGQDDTSWTLEGLPTEWNVTFNVQPLYSALMVSSADHPFLFMKNDGLLEYLGNLCGLDLKTNNMDVKIQLATQMAMARVKDIPAGLGRRLGEAFSRNVESWFQFITK